MIRYFLLTSRFFSRLVSNEQFDESSFKRFVPPLPDILHSRLVLQQFRWEGTEMSEKETKRDENEEEQKAKPVTGTTWCFLWRYRGDIFEILAFASAWIIFVFLSPLSMNLVSPVESILHVFADSQCPHSLLASSLRSIIESSSSRTFALPLRSWHLRRSNRDIDLLSKRSLSTRATRTPTSIVIGCCDIREVDAGESGRRRKQGRWRR